MGGLGNQMFQYSTGRALSLKHGVPLLLDRSYLDRRDTGITHTFREFQLDVYRTRYEIASRESLQAALRVEDNRVLRRLSRKFPRLVRNRLFRQKSTTYMPQIRHVRPPVLLEGFWQCDQYFSDIRTQLLTDFEPRQPASERNARLLEKIRSTSSISVHVRRSDYVVNPEAHRFHGVCSVDYYERAAAYHAGRVADPHFFVFSDDPGWARANIELSHSTTYISWNSGHDDYWDMYLMRHCSHHIIANSSFSWWGAWLGERPGKRVIAPARWFAAHDVNDGDIVPRDWIRL
jgi:hypothetical protein